MRQLRAEGLDFLDRAPKRFHFEATVDGAPAAVFDAISANPETWTWFPGVTGGGYSGPQPPGVGSTRTLRMRGGTYEETMLAWDAPTRWTFRVDATSAPIAKAIVEDWRVAPAAGGRSVVTWTMTMDPTPLFRILSPLAPVVMGRLFRRAMANLGRSLHAS
ncbi:MAG TPA: SRPBCC family protein [Acidimicrobiales bacterium]|nr:SRPBCC family protein [Acidimicrobiales bacterium]